MSGCSLPESSSSRGRAPPPAANAVAGKAVKPQTSVVMDTFREIAKPEGLIFTPLFVEPLKDGDARARRLETAVQELRNDFDTVMPSMVRLVAIEKDMKELVSQLQSLTGETEPIVQNSIPIPGEDVVKGTESATPAGAEADQTALTSPVTPEAAPAGQKPPDGAASPITWSAGAPVDIKPPAAAAKAETEPETEETETDKETSAPVETEKIAEKIAALTPPEDETETEDPAAVAAEMAALSAVTPAPVAGDISSVRIGDHLEKTRLVLDMSVKADVKAEMQNNGKQLVLDLGGMNWQEKPSWEADNSQLVSGWRYENGKLYVDLLYSSHIRLQQVLPSEKGGFRLIIDLFSPDVHE